jgi:hypothetical protein
MAILEPLQQNDLNQIAELIAERLPEELAQELDITETFEVWSLVNPSATDLKGATRPTGACHHQLFAGDQPVGFARSRRYATGWDVSVFQSPLAAKIEQALQRIDAHFSADITIRLLVAEKYRVYALWLVGTPGTPDRLLVLESPDGFEDLIKERGMLDVAHFLQQVAGLRPLGPLDPPSPA